MTNVSKNFKCNSCSTDFPLSLETDLEMSDFTMLSKCPKCGTSMQIHFGVLKPEQSASLSQPAVTQSQLDDSIFVPPEMPSHEIKRLIEG